MNKKIEIFILISEQVPNFKTFEFALVSKMMMETPRTPTRQVREKEPPNAPLRTVKNIYELRLINADHNVVEHVVHMLMNNRSILDISALNYTSIRVTSYLPEYKMDDLVASINLLINRNRHRPQVVLSA